MRAPYRVPEILPPPPPDDGELAWSAWNEEHERTRLCLRRKSWPRRALGWICKVLSMTVERLVKRTVWTAACECGEKDVKDSNAPRERLCKCGKWVPYVEESFTGPDTFDKR